jgi:hypothetical protein
MKKKQTKHHVTHHRKAPSMWTTVTPISKALAFILFILFPIIGFILGMNYERAMWILNTVSQQTTEVKLEKPMMEKTASDY